MSVPKSQTEDVHLAKRIDLQRYLESLVGKGRVYFEPPETLKIQYPCIVYNLSRFDPVSADNLSYTVHQDYDVQYITREPEPDIPLKLAYSKRFRAGQHFVSDGMHHFNYSVVL